MQLMLLPRSPTSPSHAQGIALHMPNETVTAAFGMHTLRPRFVNVRYLRKADVRAAH